MDHKRFAIRPEYRPLALAVLSFVGAVVSFGLLTLALELEMGWLIGSGYLLFFVCFTLAVGGFFIFAYQQFIRGGWREEARRRQLSEKRTPAPWE